MGAPPGRHREGSGPGELFSIRPVVRPGWRGWSAAGNGPSVRGRAAKRAGTHGRLGHYCDYRDTTRKPLLLLRFVGALLLR